MYIIKFKFQKKQFETKYQKWKNLKHIKLCVCQRKNQKQQHCLLWSGSLAESCLKETEVDKADSPIGFTGLLTWTASCPLPGMTADWPGQTAETTGPLPGTATSTRNSQVTKPVPLWPTWHMHWMLPPRVPSLTLGFWSPSVAFSGTFCIMNHYVSSQESHFRKVLSIIWSLWKSYALVIAKHR